ncbi:MULTISPECIES: BTAD domain-containing putative transcriptional regulator [unclassified Crossiella]|uniref:AfsR/SARP family transcriptional regulator n=1 Tax=unclassified Crossiella TaxID=2620835 RepID=UPI00200020B3|nr:MULTISPECIES: BTAD domain-containing putative transcriptional regulator [unclassified Crossiella]MCK2240511.1 tetratricopeptide repeat protein [Crossiella sp. S99.2]MCK2253038.1 tetratricopeptide repeat protein [Crossiella sp. S99.1]
MAQDELDFRVLGPLEVRVRHLALPIGGLKPRQLLATLLLNPNRLVPAETLVDALWPQSPPRSAVPNLRTYVSTLRSSLRAGGEERILAQPRGYAIVVRPDELDLLVFEELTGRARQCRADGRLELTLELLCRADGLVRGSPLEDLPPTPGWAALLRRLEERVLQATEERLAVLVALGRCEPAIAELRELLARHPFREGLCQQLMLALAGTGRDAEALQTFADLRRGLLEELGVEPGQESRRIHAALLSGELPAAEPAAAPVIRSAVSQLPPAEGDFTGRQPALDQLTALLQPVSPQLGAARIAVLTGPAGCGKSALAAQAAHAVRTRFPDGQLYLDLGGSHRPAPTGRLLAELSRSLGITDIPAGLAERAARYRSALADRRVLVWLDDAASAAQVRSLLPATSGCAVLVTSRRRLTELPGAHEIPVEALTPAEGDRLLARIVGSARIAAEPEAAATILRACGGLPLAVRIAGARLAARPGWRLSTLAARLADPASRLAELRCGDLDAGAGIAASQARLSPGAATTFGRWGLLGPAPVDADTLGDPAAVEELVDAGLAEVAGAAATGGPRYRLPELPRCAAIAAAATDPAWVRQVLDRWLHRARAATAALPVNIFAPGQRDTAATDSLPRALAWLDGERPALVEAVDLATRHGEAGLAADLALALVPYFDLGSHHEDWERTHETALAVAQGDQRAALLRGLGQLHLYRDEYARARERFTAAHELFTDDYGHALARCGLGALARVLGSPAEALDHHQAALTAFRAARDVCAEAYVRNAIGSARLAQHRNDEALLAFTDALRLSRLAGDEHRAAHVLHQLGVLHQRQGRPDRGLSCLDEALSIFERIRDAHGEAYVLRAMGELHSADGRRACGRSSLERAVLLYQRLGDRHGEAGATQLLGEVLRGERREALAEEHLRRAVRLWRDLRLPVSR